MKENETEKEIWRSIEECPTYAVSNYGNVKNIKTGRLISQSSKKNGYKSVRLCCNGKHIYRLVHRLVAFAFCEGYFEGATVNHIDECTTNNYYENLEWTTLYENLLYGTRISRIQEKEINHPSTSKGVVAISKDGTITKFPSTKEAERITGVFHNNISKVAKGKSCTAGGYVWKYIDEYEKE